MRTYFQLSLMVALSACAVEAGERARGGCPDDELCSDLTPEGLFFAAVPPSDYIGELPGLVLNGRQRITLSPGGSYDLPEFAADGGDFLTLTQAVRLDADSGEVEVVGGAPGEGLLRILAQDESGLLDRVRFPVAAPERAYVRPFVGAGIELRGFDGPWRIHENQTQLTLIAVLEGAGERLVDLDLTLATDGAVATGRPTSDRGWDVLPIQPAGVPATITIGSVTQTLEITDKVDGIEEVTTAFGESERNRVLCFVGTDGGVPVYGAPLTFSVDGDPNPVPFGEESADYPYSTRPCFSLIAAPGPHTVTIASGETTRTFDITVGEGSSSALHPSDAHAGSFGERGR